MSATASSTEVKPLEGGQKWLALTAMMFAVSMTFIDQTIVRSRRRRSSRSWGCLIPAFNGWSTATYRARCTVRARRTPVDIPGHKSMVIVGVIIFATASGLCGFTPQTSYAEAWLVLFRVIQGAGAALLFTSALAVVFAAFPARERGRALALFFGITGAFTAIGPMAGGYHRSGPGERSSG